MIICGFEKFSMVDYEGYIACTVFSGGCNFRCPFCHNAPLVIGDISAQEIGEKDVLDYLLKRKGLVDGVVVSGGEPTLQKDLKEFIIKVRDMGYKVKLDTNGTNPLVIRQLIDEGLIDYVAMDIKNCKEKYPLTIGTERVNIADIEESVELLKSTNIDTEFRTTLIKEMHTDEDMRKIASWINGGKSYYMQHYKDNDGCIAHGFSEVSKNDVERYKKYFEGKVEKIGIRGY